MHGPQYVIVARTACDVLVMPASMVASESTYSARGRIIDSFRASLMNLFAQSSLEVLTVNLVALPKLKFNLDNL